MALQHKYIDVENVKPVSGELVLAELAVNVVDGTLFTCDADGKIIEVKPKSVAKELVGRDPNYVPTGDWVVTQEIPETNEDWMGMHEYSNDLFPARPYGSITPNVFNTGQVHTAKWRKDSGDGEFVFGGNNTSDDQLNGTSPITITMEVEGETFTFTGTYTTGGGYNLYKADGFLEPAVNDFIDAAIAAGDNALIGISVAEI